MSVEIRSTTVTPTANGSVVQLYISDALPEDPSAEIVLQLSVSVPKYELAVLVEQVQHQAMKRAQRALTALLQAKLNEIVRNGFDALERGS